MKVLNRHLDQVQMFALISTVTLNILVRHLVFSVRDEFSFELISSPER